MNMINSQAKRTLTLSTAFGFILPQNGVSEGALHCGALEQQPLVSARPTAASTVNTTASSNTTGTSSCNTGDSRKVTTTASSTTGTNTNTTTTGDSRKGPTGTTTTTGDSRKVTTGSTTGSSPARPTAFPTKHELRRSSRGLMEEALLLDNSQGSLPGTPETDGELEMDADTRQLLGDFFRLFTGLSQQSRWRQSPALATMKRVVDSLLEKHRYAYNGMINKLSLDNRDDDVSFIGVVARSIFEDGTTNWGRIASLVAFGAVVCQYLASKGRHNCVELVGTEISSYLLSDQRDWLVRNNGWDGFVEFFRIEDPEGSVRHALMAVAGLAGIGATLAMWIR